MSNATRPIRKVQLSGAALILAGVYVFLLSGAANFSRLGGPDVTLRSVGVVTVVVLGLLWRATPASRVRVQSAATYMTLINVVFIYLMIAALWAPRGSDNIEKVESIGIMAIFVNLAAWVMSRSHKRILDQLWIVVFTTSFVFFVGAVASGPGSQGRYSAFGGGPNVFVRIMLLGMIASLAMYLIYNTRWSLVGVPVFLAGALLSGSRGGLIALGVFLIALVPIVRRLRWAGTLQICLLMISAAAAAILLTPTSVRDLLYNRFIALSIQQQYDSGRATYYSAAVDLFKQRPVYGWGLGGYTDVTGLHYAHNLVLGFAAEGGLIGIILLAVSLVASLTTILRSSRPLPASAVLGLVAGLSILVASLFSGDYYDSRYLWFFLIYAVYASRTEDPIAASRIARTRKLPSEAIGLDQLESFG